MLKYQFIVEIDMKCAVAGRHQAAPVYGVAELMEDFARYPSGP